MRRMTTAAAVLTMLAATWAAPAAEAAGKPFRPPCWYGAKQGVTPYKWPFNMRTDPEYERYLRRHRGRRMQGNSPECRVTPGGIKDRTPRNAIEIGRDATTLDGRSRDRPWPMVDSAGTPFAEISQTAGGVWSVRRVSDGKVWTFSEKVNILLKGRICMQFGRTSPVRAAASRYVHIRFGATVRPEGADLSFGGLIDRKALPRALQRGIRASAGCGTPAPGRLRPQPAGTVGEFFDLADPARDPRYVSERAFQRGDKTGEDLRNYYETTFGTASMVTSTTAVDGGGLVRAIVPHATPFERADGFGYPDQNYACGTSTDGVTWSYGRVIVGTRRVWGWLPRYTPVTARGC